MKLQCPHCGVAGSVDSSYRGRQVRCPKCKTNFALTPGLSARVSGDSSTVDFSSPIKLHCPHCGVEGVADESYGGRRVRCPKCSNHFQLDRNLTVNMPPSPSPTISPRTPEREDQPIGDGDLSSLMAESPSLEATAQLVNHELVAGEGRELQEGATRGASAVMAYKLPGYAVGTAGTGEQKQPKKAAQPDLVPAEDQGRDEQQEIAEDMAAARQKDKQEAVVESSEAVLFSGMTEQEGAEIPGIDIEPAAEPTGTIGQEPYGVETEQCWQCERKDNFGQTFINRAGRLYCRDCAAAEDESRAATGEPTGFGDQAAQPEGFAAEGLPYYDFSIGEALREAWEQTRGAKGTIWKGSAVMYLAILVVAFLGGFLFPSQSPDTLEPSSMLGEFVFQAATNLLSVLFTAGLLYMGVRRVAGDPIEWRMVYRGFSCAGRVVIASIMQTVLISVGILALVLPGIYLAVGYSMVLPLIVDRGMSPWEAMETSRKAIHKIWWKVAGLLCVMGLITLVSIIPMGIGMIWTWPMFIILAGVIYRYLYGSAAKGD